MHVAWKDFTYLEIFVLGGMILQVEQITLSSSSAVNYDTLSWEELETESRHNPNAKYLAVKAMLNREYHDRLCNICVEDFSRAPWLIRSDGMCRGSHCPFGRPDNHPTICKDLCVLVRKSS